MENYYIGHASYDKSSHENKVKYVFTCLQMFEATKSHELELPNSGIIL